MDANNIIWPFSSYSEDWDDPRYDYMTCMNCDTIFPAEESMPCYKCGQGLCQSCVDKQRSPIICMTCIIEGIAHC